VPKYTAAERKVVKNIVATLSIKRIPDNDIIKNIFEQTGKTLSQSGLFRVRQQIKKESAKWYSQLRESEYEYIHEFKERIREIEFLQRKHHEIIDSNPNNATVQQVSLAALHKLNLTLSNYYDVAPAIGDTQRQLQVTGNSIQEDQNQARRMFKIEGCTCPHDGRDIISHSKCRHCLCIWCPTAMKQDWCPNPECSSGIAGCKFEPYDSLRKWVECKCGMWFKTQEVMDAHREISIACKDIIV
jgi:hypothetical protein